MKKVLYVLSNEPTGGVGTVVLNYQNYYTDKIQIDYLIYTNSRDTAFQKKVSGMNSTIHFLPDFSIRELPTIIKETRLFFERNAKEYSIIHLHFAGIAFLVFYYAKKFGIKNRIVHSHNTKLSDNLLKNLRNRVLCLPMKSLSTHFFACSKNAAEYLYGKSFCSKNKILIMNNAVDIGRFSFNPNKRESIRSELKVESDKVLIHVGRFEEQKNHPFLVSIMKLLKDKNVKLLLIGDGPERENILSQVDINGLSDKIIYIGTINNVEDYLSAADIFVLPSLYEGLPLTAVEAQASGLFCLLSNKITKDCEVGGNVQFIDIDNEYAWVSAINEYQGTRLSGAIVDDYNIQSKARQIEEFYLNLD